MNREEFTAAVVAGGGAMFRAARSCADSDAGAEDAVGEAVLRAWEKWGALRDPRAARAWLVKIAVNCALEARRKTVREVQGHDMEAVAGTVPPPGEPSSLWEAVCHLPEDQRAAVTLYYYEQFSVREIAKTLAVAEGTVKSRLSRGRSALKQMLEREE